MPTRAQRNPKTPRGTPCGAVVAEQVAAADEIRRLVTAEGAVALSGSAAVVDRVVRWTAARSAARAATDPSWDEDVERRWAAAAATALRLLGDRGRGLAGAGRLRAAATAQLVAALAESGGRRARRTAGVVRRDDRARGGRDLLKPDLHDPAAATAIIRSGWGADAVRVLLEYRDAIPHLEVAVGDRLLVDGPWEWGTSVDGRPLDAEGAWTVAGWESGRKAAFLEIAAPLAGGLRLERQVVMLRRQRIVVLADAVVPADAAGGGSDGAADGELAHRATVRLAAGLGGEAAAETREVIVGDDAPRFMTLPLALPEWRAAGRGGLVVADGTLALEQVGHRRMYAPLWLDCDPRRIGRPLTWRQLTVADTRRNLPAHQAAGFRVQAGTRQWLLYRALDQPRNRTLLGCNVSAGFLCGRIKRSGEVARTLEIE
ncbi:MAG: hypothetical protein ACKOSQ_11635 [Planctomycetaceae bacterium]